MCPKNSEAKYKKSNLANSHQSASWIIHRQLHFLEIFAASWISICESSCAIVVEESKTIHTWNKHPKRQFVFLINRLYKENIICIWCFNSILMAEAFLWNKMSQFQLHHWRNILALQNLVCCITYGPTLTSEGILGSMAWSLRLSLNVLQMHKTDTCYFWVVFHC